MIGFDDFLDGYLQSEVDEIPHIDTIIADDIDENNFERFNLKSSKLTVDVSQFSVADNPVAAKEFSTDSFYDAIEVNFEPLEAADSDRSSDNVICEIDNDLDNDFNDDNLDNNQLIEMCKLCNCTNEMDSDDYNDSDSWLICYGCGEAFHRKCLADRLQRIKCEMPIIFRKRIAGPEGEKKYFHAPWFCNNCIECSCCSGKEDSKLKVEELRIPNESVNILLKDSYVACRHCGKVICLSCYNSESFNSAIFSHQLSRFENLKNYSCPGCLECINCGLSASVTSKDPFSTKSRRRASICAQMLKQTVFAKTPSISLYKDSTLCRPCYLSDQMCAICPRCKQIYHSLQDHYDFGEAPFNSDFCLCPMIMCDYCGSWTHCQCEGIDDKEYERLGTDKNAKFKCFDCRKNIKKRPKQKYFEMKQAHKQRNRNGNIISIEENRIIFMYWSSDETWKRKIYELSFYRAKNGFLFTLTTANFCLESDSIVSLNKKFTEMFKLNTSKLLKCVNPKFFLNPMNLLTMFEASRLVGFKNICSYLREEICRDCRYSSARTESIFKVKSAHVRKLITKDPISLNYNNSIPSGSSSPAVSVGSSSGRTSLKYLYMQYSQSVRSDESSYTIDSVSQGLALRPSPIAGFGLFATRQFLKNSLIIEYCGEMLTGDDVVDKRDAYYNALGKRYRQSCYLFRLDELKVLDATHKGNLSRFINHSCDPNCYSRVVQIDDSKKLLIFASRFIEAGEEILYDYKFPDEEQKIPCLCGSEKCRKWMN